MCSFCAVHKALPPSVLGPALGAGGPGSQRFQKGDKLYLEYVADSAPNSNVEAWADVLYDNGEFGELGFNEPASGFPTGVRTRRRSREGARLNGYVVGGGVSGPDLRLERGQLYTQFGLEGSGGRIRVLGQDYIYDGHVLPAGRYVDPGPTGGFGFLDPVDLGDPAANTEYTTQAIPALKTGRPIGFAGTLVTDANAASRRFTATVRDAGDTVFGSLFLQGLGHTAGLTIRHLAGRGLGSFESGVAGSADYRMAMADFVLPTGYDIVFLTNAIQVTDNWGDGELHFEFWEMVFA